MNNSTVMESILLGITDGPELQPLLFVLFLVVYLVTLLGNLGLIMLIRMDSHLHTPMYFFLINLAFVDLCYASNATPQMLTNFLSEKKTISFVGCFTQCYIFIALLLTEFYMGATMAYDWISATLSNSLTIVLVSYAFIIVAILWIKSSEGQQKASFICGSHDGCNLVLWDKTLEESKIIAVFYTFVSLVLNPRCKHALKNVLKNTWSRWWSTFSNKP